jgi:hypothetical protein
LQAITRERQRQHHEHQDLWDKFWKDKDGNVVVYQRPNIWLISWVVLTLLSLFLNGAVSSYLWWLALVSLTIWSLLEIFKGVNYLRRLLGVIVLVLTIMAALKAGL